MDGGNLLGEQLTGDGEWLIGTIEQLSVIGEQRVVLGKNGY